MSPRATETFLRFFLRWEGTVSLLALGAVFMPYSTMDAIHRWLRLGPLPAEPIVGYLARSASALYAMFGALLWFFSFDVHRHRVTIRFFGGGVIVFGALLLGIDLVEGLPPMWRYGEGPVVMLVGFLIAWPAHRLTPRGELKRW